jgi:hypothetical protein
VNRRTKSLALAIGVALIVVLFWQRARIEKLRAENGDLGAKLAAAQAEPREQPSPMTPASPDPELMRLRAEVAELRRQKDPLRSNTTSHVTQSSNVSEPVELPFEVREQHSTWVLMRLVLAMHMIMVDREEQKAVGKLEIVDANGALTAALRRESEKLLSEGEEMKDVHLDVALRDVEFLITDAAEIRKLHPNTIVARSVPMKMPNGKWRRVYAFADGSAHRRVHDTPDEIWQASPQ